MGQTLHTTSGGARRQAPLNNRSISMCPACIHAFKKKSKNAGKIYSINLTVVSLGGCIKGFKNKYFKYFFWYYLFIFLLLNCNKHIIIFFLWPCCTLCGIVASRPGREPGPLTETALSLSHWTTRELPINILMMRENKALVL